VIGLCGHASGYAALQADYNNPLPDPPRFDTGKIPRITGLTPGATLTPVIPGQTGGTGWPTKLNPQDNGPVPGKTENTDIKFGRVVRINTFKNPFGMYVQALPKDILINDPGWQVEVAKEFSTFDPKSGQEEFWTLANDHIRPVCTGGFPPRDCSINFTQPPGAKHFGA
jgi:hypothetical protein